MSQSTGDPVFRARRKLFVWADHYQLEDSERIELAQYMLRRDITSWKQLTEEQVYRLLDAFEGHHLLSMLLELRSPTEQLETDIGGQLAGVDPDDA